MKLTFIIGRFSTYIHGPIDAENLFGARAITGSESSFLNVVRGFAELGNEVEVQGDFVSEVESCGPLGGARVTKIDEASPIADDSDAYFSLNEPDQFRRLPKKVEGLRYLHMQYNDYAHCQDGWYDHVDVNVALSPVHKQRLMLVAGIHPNRIAWIPNSIEPSLFEGLPPESERDPHAAVWCSSPDRGLHRLLEIWPDVRRKVPGATLRVCYRFEPWYERFKLDMSKTGQRARYIGEAFRRLGTKGEHGVHLVDAIPNRAMAATLGGAAVLPYTCDPMSFTEGFSVSIMDACAAGALPIISDADAIGDIYDGVAHVIPGKPGEKRQDWVDAVVRAMTDASWRDEVTTRARAFSKHFERKNVVALWDVLVKRNLSRRNLPHDFGKLPNSIADFVDGSWKEVVEAPKPSTEPVAVVGVPQVVQREQSIVMRPLNRKLRVAVILGKMSSDIHGIYDIDKLFDEGLLTGTGSNFFNIVWGLAERGHQVDAFCEATRHFYNHPKLGGASVYNIDEARPDDTYDAYISVNEPDMLRIAPKGKLRVCAMWLNDFSFCRPGFDNQVDVYACPSDTHARYLATASGVETSKLLVMPLSFNSEFYDEVVERRPGSIAYCSSPDRGLHHLLDMFGAVKEQVPEANLRIYYRFQPWYDTVMSTDGMGAHRDRAIAIGNHLDFYGRNGEKGVTLVGPIPSKKMALELLSTKVMAYPCDAIRFTEGFSMSVMDACAAGCVPIVAATDSLPEIYSGAAFMIKGKPNESREKWISAIVAGLKNDDFVSRVRSGAKAFSNAYTRQKIALLWETLLCERIS